MVTKLIELAAKKAGGKPTRRKPTPYMEGFRGKDGQWYLRLVAGNGKTLFTSEGYRRKWEIQRALEAHRRARFPAFRWA